MRSPLNGDYNFRTLNSVLGSPEDWEKYKLYMKSSEWRSIAMQVWQRDDFTCQMCNIHSDELEHNNCLVCHHVTYENLYEEGIEELLTLCRMCHDSHHDNDRIIERVRAKRKLEDRLIKTDPDEFPGEV